MALTKERKGILAQALLEKIFKGIHDKDGPMTEEAAQATVAGLADWCKSLPPELKASFSLGEVLEFFHEILPRTSRHQFLRAVNKFGK